MNAKHSRNIQLKRVADGTHNFQGEQGSELARKNANERVANGAHHLLGGEIVRKQVAEGKNALVGNVSCIDKQGNNVQVPKEVYHKQKEVTKDQTHWEFVMNISKEAKTRKETSCKAW